MTVRQGKAYEIKVCSEVKKKHKKTHRSLNQQWVPHLRCCSKTGRFPQMGQCPTMLSQKWVNNYTVSVSLSAQ